MIEFVEKYALIKDQKKFREEFRGRLKGGEKKEQQIHEGLNKLLTSLSQWTMDGRTTIEPKLQVEKIKEEQEFFYKACFELIRSGGEESKKYGALIKFFRDELLSFTVYLRLGEDELYIRDEDGKIKYSHVQLVATNKISKIREYASMIKPLLADT